MIPAKLLTDTQALSAAVPPARPEKRRYRSKQERRRIVEEALAPGASVARVARAHEVNASQVHYWRKLYQQGLLDDGAPPAIFLPVRLSERVPQESVGAAAAPRGVIEIEAGHTRVRIEGAADPVTVRVLLEQLLG